VEHECHVQMRLKICNSSGFAGRAAGGGRVGLASMLTRVPGELTWERAAALLLSPARLQLQEYCSYEG
jgi:hypothetical protein